MKKLRRLGCLFVVGVAVLMAIVLASCESSDDWATLTIINQTSELLYIYLDTLPQADSPPHATQIIEVNTNAHLVTWVGATVQGEVTVTIPACQNLTLRINGGLQNYSLE